MIAAAGVVAVSLLFAVHATGERRRRDSVSMGSTSNGSLINGAKLPESGVGFFSNPERPNATAVYGTDELIAALVKAGADVETRAPGARLFINDIGFAEGGPIAHHASHRAGRDADVLFYMLDAGGEVVAPKCIPFDRDGHATWGHGTPNDATDDEQRVFDDQRNWAVVRSLVEGSKARVQRIFVAEWIRARLLRYALEHDEPGWVVERAGDVMCEPSSPHDDHFHVRVFCTVDDYRRGCRDMWPVYPWRRTELAARGLIDPVLSRPRTRGGHRRPSGPPRKTPGRLWCP